MADTMPNENFTKTLAFYEKANFILRIALFVAVLWPVLAIATALFLTPANARTIVPLVTLSPLVPVFFLVIGAPFNILLLWQDPDAKQGFLWLAALIAVELSIGVYFAVIPVSNDTKLVPLLILTALALFFLNIAKIAHWLFLLLSLLLIAITIIFIVGGSPKVKDFYGQVVDPPNTPSTNTTGNRVNLQPSQQSTNPATVTPSAAPPPNPQPAPFQPQWDKAQHMAIEDFLWVSAPCIKRAANLHCFFRVTNLGKSVGAEIDNHDWAEPIATRMIDEQGIVYVASAVHLGSSDSISRASNSLPSNVPVLGQAIFENVTGTRVALLEIKCSLDDHYNHQVIVDIRDLPIQLDDGTMLSHPDGSSQLPTSDIKTEQRFATDATEKP